jgi:hypothetical protein
MCSMTHVDALTRVLTERQDTPAVKRLRLRIRELGENAHDEVKQLDQLRKACREDPALAAALLAAGLPDLAAASGPRISPELGAVVQAFNTVVEEVWSRRSVPPASRR